MAHERLNHLTGPDLPRPFCFDDGVMTVSVAGEVGGDF